MYSEPCARLIMSMMPNTSVRPAASRNSINPNCRPLRACSNISNQDKCWRTRSLHCAVLHVRVAVVLEHRADGLVDQAALRILADDAQVVVLDRVLVLVELERPAHRLPLGVEHRLARRIDVL